MCWQKLTGKPCDKCINYNGDIRVCSKCFNKSEWKANQEPPKKESNKGVK